MPELPEVEHAARVAREAVAGRALTGLRALHPSIARDGEVAAAHALVGRTLVDVRRIAKWQAFLFDDGAVLDVHFRMTGDWAVTDTPEAPPHARLVFDFAGSRRLWLVDPRVLGRVAYRPPGAPRTERVGPDAHDPSVTAAVLRDRLARRTVAIKQALLDQSIVAGLGNIYAAEALWYARIHPGTPASSIPLPRLARLVEGIRWTLGAALSDPGRQAYGESLDRLSVYDKEGRPCPRCAAPIRRMVQGQRSTYWCARCQR